jgi:hypothetical protein
MSEDIKNTITDLNINIIELKKELDWFREYAHYVRQNHYKVDAEACSYADGDFENWNE